MPTPKQYPNNAARQSAYRKRQALARNAERHAKGLPAAPAIPTIPANRRWDALLQHALSALEAVRDEMDDYINERTEEWQEGERGQALQNRKEAIDEIVSSLNDLMAV